MGGYARRPYLWAHEPETLIQQSYFVDVYFHPTMDRLWKYTKKNQSKKKQLEKVLQSSGG